MQARTRIVLVLVPLLISIIYTATRIVSFAHLFFEHAGIALTQAEVHDTFVQYSTTGGRDPRPEYIPRHIHQVWHEWSTGNVSADLLPVEWQQASDNCTSLMPDWDYTLWTAQMSREFIAKEYPWFLETYDGYSLPIQRIDTMQYFIMRHYGGIYVDLDVGCLENLAPLLHYPTWVTNSGHGALSNKILASMPEHPFWVLMTESLISYNWKYVFPYVTASYASGRWFETAIWETYHKAIQKPRLRGSKNHKEFQGHGDAKEEPEEDLRLHRLVTDTRPGADPWIYFTKVPGGMWRSWDNDFFSWIGNHLILITSGILGLVVAVGWAIRSYMRKASIKKKGYARVQLDGYDLDLLER